jgi:hypothetical protein
MTSAENLAYFYYLFTSETYNTVNTYYVDILNTVSPSLPPRGDIGSVYTASDYCGNGPLRYPTKDGGRSRFVMYVY